MAAGHPNDDLGRWHTGAACSLDCEDGCGIIATHLRLATARAQARYHARKAGHHVTIEYPKFQTVSPPKETI